MIITIASKESNGLDSVLFLTCKCMLIYTSHPLFIVDRVLACQDFITISHCLPLLPNFILWIAPQCLE